MPFLLLGIVILIIGIYFFRLSAKHHDHEGEHGSIALIVAGIILILIFGLFYRSLTLVG